MTIDSIATVDRVPTLGSQVLGDQFISAPDPDDFPKRPSFPSHLVGGSVTEHVEEFISRAGLADVPLCTFDNPRGTIAASTVEATAVDLVGYMDRAGGVDRVAGMLLELSEKMDPDLLVDAARSAPALWAQRLGFLLEFVGASDRCAPLMDHVRQRGHNYTRLLPSASAQDALRSREWRLLVNAPIEVEA